MENLLEQRRGRVNFFAFERIVAKSHGIAVVFMVCMLAGVLWGGAHDATTAGPKRQPHFLPV